jgi:DNA-binding transcriptional MocR family regulator
MDITKIVSGLSISPDYKLPRYMQLVNFLALKIQEGILPQGTKLPAERELAKLLKVSRTTILNAYKTLEEKNLIISKQGSGTYINTINFDTQTDNTMPWNQLFSPQYKSPLASLLRTLIATPTENSTISLAAGMPDPAFYPNSILNYAFEKNLSISPAEYGYLPTEGYFPLRKALADWQAGVGINSTVDQNMIVSGSQQGLYLSVKAFIEPHDYVIIETPSYLGAIQAFESAGARILTLPPTERVNFKLLEDYLIRYRPKLMYTIPTFQNPTGRVMSLEDRQTLLRLAKHYQLIIIEDDPYSLLYYGQQPPVSLKGLDTYGGVIYLGTFSKTLLPGLRTGWVTAAQPVINCLAQEKQHIDLHSNNLSQIILQTCLSHNILAQHLEKVRPEYKKRRDTMIFALQRFCHEYIDFTVPPGGFYIWCKMKYPISITLLMHQAAVEGVTFVPGIAFYPNGIQSNEFRLCFVTHNETILTEGIRRLGKLLAATSTNQLPQKITECLPLV